MAAWSKSSPVSTGGPGCSTKLEPGGLGCVATPHDCAWSADQDELVGNGEAAGDAAGDAGEAAGDAADAGAAGDTGCPMIEKEEAVPIGEVISTQVGRHRKLDDTESS